MEMPNGDSKSLPSKRESGTWPASEDKYTAAIIRRKARQLVSRTEMSASDQEDIEQELAIHLWLKAPAYDPQRGPWLAFATTLVSHEATKLLQKHRAKKRSNGSVTSLNNDATNGKSTGQLYPDSAQGGVDARTGHVRISGQALAELAIDIEVLTKSLSAEMQLMLKLRSIKPMTEVSREMGIPRSTLNARMKQIRSRFESAGLKKYFHK